MGRNRISRPESGPDRGRHPAAPVRRAGRRARGLDIIERDDNWHVSGTIAVGSRSRRVRESTKLAATAENRADAEAVKWRIETETRNELLYGIHPSVPVEVAVGQYLNRLDRNKRSTKRRKNSVDKRLNGARKKSNSPKRTVNASVVYWLQELADELAGRLLNTINDEEWNDWIDGRTADNQPASREQYINAILTFLGWCMKRPRYWLADLPAIERDTRAQRPKAPARQVWELRPDLMALLIEHARPHLKPQIAVMWATGGRGISLLHHCRLCDYVDAPGGARITFHDTKNGTDVEAALPPWVVMVMSEYLEWRGRLHDFEGPLFLTHRKKPYKLRRITVRGTETVLTGGQNRTAFRGAIDRAGRALRRDALVEVATLRRQGRRTEARALWLGMRRDLHLLAQLTPHWFRHRLATWFVANGDLRSGMEQGGWLSVRSILHYAHDIPEHRRKLVEAMEAPATSPDGKLLTRTKAVSGK